MKWGKPSSLEDILLAVVLILLAGILLYWLAGCTSAMHKTATLKYHNKQDCEWRLSGMEAIRAEQIGAELEVGEDCTLKRKADAATDKKPP